MSQGTRQLYDFGEFRLDLIENVLRRHGKPISLTPKSLHLLCLLVENHGRILDKDWLMAEMWADSFVEDGNLSFNIRMLRKALEDNAAEPTFIETIPRRGYRFIAEISEPFEPESPDKTEFVEVAPTPRSSRNWLLIAGSAVFGIVTIAAIALFAIEKFGGWAAAPILIAKFSTDKFTNSGNVRVAAISPDGQYAAYVDDIGGKESVWLRRIETEESIQILPPSGDYYFGLTFSRDGKSLFLVRKPVAGHALPTLYRVSSFGGVPVKILEGVMGWVGVSPDDKMLSFVRCNYKPTDFCSLFVSDAEGGNQRKLVARESPTHIKDNGFSPDGKTIAFASGNSDKGSSDMKLNVVDVETGNERAVSSRTFFDIKGLDWLPDGREILFSAKEYLDGKASMWKVPLATGDSTKLVDDPNSYFAVSIDKNGSRMISTQVSNNYRLYLSTDIGERSLAAAREFTFGPNKKIIYASDDRNIWEINADGSGQRQLTTDVATDFSPRVSPDGSSIFFTSNRTGQNHVWRMDADGANQKQVTKVEGGYPRLVTPDGQWVLYQSGRSERLWKVSTITGEETEIVSKKLFSPSISPDGRLVAFFFRDGVFKIGIIRLEDGELIKTLEPGDGKSFTFTAAWSSDSGTIYFIDNRDQRNQVWRQSIDQEVPETVADLGIDNIEIFETIPDGTGFAFTRGRWTHDAVLITGLK